MKHERRLFVLGLFFGLVICVSGQASAFKENATYLLPLNCSELLPDNTTFLSYFEAVGRGQVISDKTLSRKIFRVLALRDKLNSTPDLFQGINPIDVLIRKTLCYYRQQKDALQVVTYYDPKMVSYLKENIKDLETKVDSAIFNCQFQQETKEALEKRAKKNEALVQDYMKEAQKSANQSFEKITKEAARKAKVN
jgi:hypothetical protein